MTTGRSDAPIYTFEIRISIGANEESHVLMAGGWDGSWCVTAKNHPITAKKSWDELAQHCNEGDTRG